MLPSFRSVRAGGRAARRVLADVRPRRSQNAHDLFPRPFVGDDMMLYLGVTKGPMLSSLAAGAARIDARHCACGGIMIWKT